VKLWQDQSFRGYSRMELSPGNFVDWKASSTSFDGMSAYVARSLNLVGVGLPERLDGTLVTPDLFSVLGAHAALGRVFDATDGEDAKERSVILSDTTWRRLFGGDASVLGRHITMDGNPYVVVGVMPATFYFPTRDTELWLPLRFKPPALRDRADTHLQAIARLRDGASLQSARTEMSLIAARLARAFPEANDRTGATVIWLRDEVSRQSRQLLVALVVASWCVLIIAVANVANLLLARALARRQELAVRVALGAAPERLVRQMITESLLLSTIGGVLGVVLAFVVLPLASRLVPNGLPIADVPALDLRVLLVAATLTVATGVAFGVVPALRLGRKTDVDGLRDRARAGSSRQTELMRSVLVVAEITASVALLISAGLLIRALWRVANTNPGFRPDGVLTLRTTLPAPKYQPTERRTQYYRQVLAEVKALPGVEGAAYISFLPMVMRGGIWPVTIAGRGTPPNESPTASLRFVTPGFFDTLSIPVVRGRDVAESDTASTQFVAVVCDSFARAHWPGADPLGQRFFVAFRERVVVGIVGDIRVRGLERESEPQIYLPYQQVPDGGLYFYAPQDMVIKAAAPATLPRVIRDIVARVDGEQPVADVRLLTDIVAADVGPRRVQIRALALFAAIAFVLAALGIHGLLAFSVSTRLREIGVRIALGARAPDIFRMIVARAMLLAAVGVGIGAAIAYAGGRKMESMLAGVSPADSPTFISAIVLALVMTLIGSIVPALRAVKVDPLIAMRAD
jgi:predicted permease